MRVDVEHDDFWKTKIGFLLALFLFYSAMAMRRCSATVQLLGTAKLALILSHFLDLNYKLIRFFFFSFADQNKTCCRKIERIHHRLEI